jgi:Lrp/AsnC family transcriptional regulator, regulator for asnA, asnC and gidA
VMRVTAVADPGALDLHTHAVIGLRVEQARLEQLSERLVAMEELSYVYETVGQFDLIVVGFFRSDEELRVFLTHKLAQLPGILRSETYHIMRTIKRSLRWGEATDMPDEMHGTTGAAAFAVNGSPEAGKEHIHG